MPDHTDLHFELALCARADGDLDEAERLARHCLALGDAPPRYAAVVGSGTFLALCLLGELAETRGDREAAEAFYLRSLAEYPEYVAPVLPATTFLLKRSASLAELRETLPLDRPSAALLAATACFEQARVEEAEILFHEVIERQASNDAGRIGLAETYLSAKRWDDAAAAAAGVAEESPLAAAAAGEVAFAHAVGGDAARLRAALANLPALSLVDRLLYEAWATSLEGAPLPTTIPSAALGTAVAALEALLRVQEFDAFARLVAAAERIAVPQDDWRELLAQMYLRRGFLDSAAQEWIAVAQERPSARAFVGLAQVAYARDLHEDAVAFAEHALALDPGSRDARTLVDALRQPVAA